MIVISFSFYYNACFICLDKNNMQFLLSLKSIFILNH